MDLGRGCKVLCVDVLNIRCAIVKTVKWKMEIHFKWPVSFWTTFYKCEVCRVVKPFPAFNMNVKRSVCHVYPVQFQFMSLWFICIKF